MYLASGGDPRWLGPTLAWGGITRELGKQHLSRIRYKTEGKLRFPAPGGRFYIMPAAVGEKDVPRGHIELDKYHATAWVNDQDWLEYIVEILGGCTLKGIIMMGMMACGSCPLLIGMARAVFWLGVPRISLVTQSVSSLRQLKRATRSNEVSPVGER